MLKFCTPYPESKFWLKIFYDNGGSMEKSAKIVSDSEKNNGGYRVFLNNLAAVTGVLGRIAMVTVLS